MIQRTVYTGKSILPLACNLGHFHESFTVIYTPTGITVTIAKWLVGQKLFLFKFIMGLQSGYAAHPCLTGTSFHPESHIYMAIYELDCVERQK